MSKGKRRRLSDDPMVRAIRRHGWGTMRRAVTFAGAWAICAEALGRPPGIEEYAAWWAQPYRTAYREQAAFREVTGLASPEPIWRRAREAGVEFDRDAGGFGGFALLPFMVWAD